MKKFKSVIKKIETLLCAGIMCISTAVTAFAAENDMIDSTQKGSVTVHKYDMTAAKNDGVDLEVFNATGEKDDAAQAALSKYGIKGVEFTYLKVSDIVTYSESGDIRVIYGIEPELRQMLNLEASDAVKTVSDTYFYSMQELNDGISELLMDSTDGRNAMESYVKSHGGTAMPLTDENGLSAADHLELGLYLMVETKVPENVFLTCDPFFVSVPSTDHTGDYWFYNIDVYPKNQTINPTLDKKVKSDEPDAGYEDTAMVSGGETVDYIVVSKLPRVSSKASYLSVYTLTDSLAKGIEYQRDTEVYFYTSKADAYNHNTSNAAGHWTAADADVKYTVAYTGSREAGSQMVLSMTEAGLEDINPVRSEQNMVVAYTADIHSGADIVTGDAGNTNHVKLEWRRTSTDYFDVLMDQCEVYTYGYDLTKQFSNNRGDFSKVQFVLKNETDGHYLTAVGSDGLYYVNGKSDTEDGAAKFTPDSNGKLIIREIEADTYIFTEVHTSAGFSLLKDDIRISITGTNKTIIPSEASITGTPDFDNAADYYAAEGKKVRKFVEVTENAGASAKVDEKDAAMTADGTSGNALVQMHVLNSEAPILPKTGGTGLYAVTIIGILTFAAGILMTIRSRKGGKNGNK